jgi:hypothetical protein
MGVLEFVADGSLTMDTLDITGMEVFDQQKLRFFLDDVQYLKFENLINQWNEKWNELDKNRKKLVKGIKRLYRSESGDRDTTSSFVCDPVILVSGQFAQDNAKFMCNPDENEGNIYGWDDDLEDMRMQSMEVEEVDLGE